MGAQKRSENGVLHQWSVKGENLGESGTLHCSVGCYKIHKDGCKPQESGSVSNVSELYPALKEVIQQDGNGHHFPDIFDGEEDDDEEEESDRVPLEKLRLLAESKELKSLLCNPHLKQLLLTVDKAEDKESIMKTAMQEPIFVEFADQCLQIVEPPEKENEIFASEYKLFNP
ncbi:hypothetical protein scyTo_0003004 [Scyliorhinus torazame]|uniref:Zinc finger HIT domain-containing protein n=1 Tax=Scyliorhinus torazame TaxID=75743 RepID=A0A401PLA7_SCYTO|nr:hypothetical protein [Scyliorhinus torazame]